MTVNEAIEELKYDCNELGKAIPCDTSWAESFENAYAMAINAMEELQQYRKAEENGLLLRLPCKVGDNVYIIAEKSISEQRVQRATNDSEGKIEFCTRKRGFALFDFGKTVFLTHEEAEAKLAEMEGSCQ